jgi:DHA1 family tetracycline resistance protein-like MFS transporter
MVLMLAVVFVDLLGFGIIIPLLPFYGLRFAADPFAVTMLMGTYSGCQLLAAPLWGRLSDTIGRRPVVLVSLATSVVAYLWLSRASALWMLFAARAVQGASAGNISVAQAYIADLTRPENRAKWMGLVGAAIGLGFTLGPAIGGWLAGTDLATLDVTLPALAAAAMSGAALLIALVFLPESLPAAERARGSVALGRLALIRDAFARSRLRPLLLLFFADTFAFACMESTFGQWAYARLGWGPGQVGSVLGGVGAVLILIQGGVIGRLTRRYGEPRLLFAGTVVIGIGLAGMVIAATPIVAVAACSLLALGQGLASPATSALVSREAGAHEQGRILGVNQSMGSAARLLGPAVAGIAFEWWGAGAPYAVGAIVMIGAAVLAWRVLHERRLAAPAAPVGQAAP